MLHEFLFGTARTRTGWCSTKSQKPRAPISWTARTTFGPSRAGISTTDRRRGTWSYGGRRRGGRKRRRGWREEFGRHSRESVRQGWPRSRLEAAFGQIESRSARVGSSARLPGQDLLEFLAKSPGRGGHSRNRAAPGEANGVPSAHFSGVAPYNRIYRLESQK